MKSAYLFYLCPTCFEATQDEEQGHRHGMLLCDPGPPGDERRKPLADESGRLKTRAPRWFLEAVGWLRV